jgi:hypothetical protein
MKGDWNCPGAWLCEGFALSYGGPEPTHDHSSPAKVEVSAGLRVPAAEIEQLVSSRVHRWLLDPSGIYKLRLGDLSLQQRLIA